MPLYGCALWMNDKNKSIIKIMEKKILFIFEMRETFIRQEFLRILSYVWSSSSQKS